MRQELQSTTAVDHEHELQSVTSIGKGEKYEIVSVVDTVQEPQTANSISSVTRLAVDNTSKSIAKFWLHLPDLEGDLQVEEKNVADVPASPAPMRTESPEEATEYCPVVITEPIRQTDDRNTETCEDLSSDSPSEKCIPKSAPVPVTNMSDKQAEQAEEIVSCLATHGGVDYVDEITVITCVGSCAGSCDSNVDWDLCNQVISVPDEPLVPLTQKLSMANKEVSGAIDNKCLEHDLQTLPQASEDAVTSYPATQVYSTNKPMDINTERIVKQGTNVAIERDDPAPHPRSNASTFAIRTAVESPHASDVRAQAPLPRKVTVSSATVLSHSPSNLANSKSRAMERNQHDSSCKRGLPSFPPQSCSSGQKHGLRVSSCAVSTPVAKAAFGKNSWAAVSTEPSASGSEPTRMRHSDLPGRSSAVGAENTESTKAYAAGHLFHPSQGRYVLKKEVLQDGDELGTGATFCTVVWVPTGGTAKP
ncbi:uncharacterized protein LOC119402560 [Rhipicephalus sanguineus]|uniref:uncharacterized protein LOC119402560 n=1 Tax=Rhipicephalus sanguineus TaxID=34632 RepID=UPI0020C494A0|nr:uncharacterized protein LOC119402560 [Rhipicephalus sanguineus]